MAGHIQDRWYKTEKDENGKPHRVKTDRHGTGMRYRARYIGPDGTEQSQSFPDRQKGKAEEWLTQIKADMSNGDFIHPKAARITFGQYAEKWLATLTSDPSTRASVRSQIQLHAIPYLGKRPMDSFEPSHIREWLSELETAVPATSYRHVIFGNVSGVFMAAVEDRLRKFESVPLPLRHGARHSTEQGASLVCQPDVRRPRWPSRAAPSDGGRGRRVRPASRGGLWPAGR
jgi:hypothetical protein